MSLLVLKLCIYCLAVNALSLVIYQWDTFLLKVSVDCKCDARVESFLSTFQNGGTACLRKHARPREGDFGRFAHLRKVYWRPASYSS